MMTLKNSLCHITEYPAPPGSENSGVIELFLQGCHYIFLCLRLCWIVEQYIFKMGDNFIKARQGAVYCATLVDKYVKGQRSSKPLTRIDEDCSDASAARWISEAGVPALYATSAYVSMKTAKVGKGTRPPPLRR